MKITPNIDDALLMEAKALAASKGTTLSNLVEEGLRMRLQIEQLNQLKARQFLSTSAGAAKPSVNELFGIAPDYGSEAT